MLSDAQKKELADLFYGSDQSFILGSFDKFLDKVREKKININRKDVQLFYDNQEITQIMRPPPSLNSLTKKKKYYKIMAFLPFDRFYMDTMFIKKYSIAILVGLDLFSRYGFAKVLQNTTRDAGVSSSKAVDAVQEFRKIANDMGYDFSNIYVDDGSEFKKAFSSFVKDNDLVKIVSNPNNPLKNRNIERFNKTLRLYIEKYFNVYGGKITQNVMNKLIYAYNNTVHASLYKHTPSDVLTNVDVQNDVISKNELSKEQDLDDKPNVNIIPNGTSVRYYYRWKDGFRKTGKNWTKTIFTVSSYNKAKQMYGLDGADELFRPEFLQIVDKDLLKEYNAKPTIVAPRVNEDNVVRNVGITKDIRDVLSQPVIETKRERKAPTRLDL